MHLCLEQTMIACSDLWTLCNAVCFFLLHFALFLQWTFIVLIIKRGKCY